MHDHCEWTDTFLSFLLRHFWSLKSGRKNVPSRHVEVALTVLAGKRGKVYDLLLIVIHSAFLCQSWNSTVFHLHGCRRNMVTCNTKSQNMRNLHLCMPKGYLHTQHTSHVFFSLYLSSVVRDYLAHACSAARPVTENVVESK